MYKDVKLRITITLDLTMFLPGGGEYAVGDGCGTECNVGYG